MASTASDSEDNYDNLAYQQRLKAAIHYTVKQLLQEQEIERDVKFNKQFAAVLAEATTKYAKRMAIDLELFARHAKRSTVQTEDVKLLVRKSPLLVQHLEEFLEEINAGQPEKRAKKSTSAPRSKKKKSTAAAVEDANDAD